MKSNSTLLIDDLRRLVATAQRKAAAVTILPKGSKPVTAPPATPDATTAVDQKLQRQTVLSIMGVLRGLAQGISMIRDDLTPFLHEVPADHREGLATELANTRRLVTALLETLRPEEGDSD